MPPPREDGGAGEQPGQRMATQGQAAPGRPAPAGLEVPEGGDAPGQHHDKLQRQHPRQRLRSAFEKASKGDEQRGQREPGHSPGEARAVRVKPQGPAQQQDCASPGEAEADALQAGSRHAANGGQPGKARQPEAGPPVGGEGGQVEQAERKRETQRYAGQRVVKGNQGGWHAGCSRAGSGIHHRPPPRQRKPRGHAAPCRACEGPPC